ncbi:MAG TPA: hypothetical protein VFK36_13755 [Gemmatimonadales bacterium]|nr:hypothetical protein [Gemmatimonadales bacterium]
MSTLVQVPAPPRGRVVLLSSTAWGIRNVVVSGLLERLRERLDVRLLVSSTANNALSEGCQAGADDMLLSVTGPPHDPVGVLLDASFARRHRLRSYDIFGRWNQRGRGPAYRFSRLVLKGLSRVGAREPVLGWLVASEHRRALRRPGMEAIRAQLRALAPDLVVSTASVVPDEAAYARAAGQLGIPTLGCILSFDNLTSRGRQPPFDHYAVWGRRMADEVLRLHPDRDPSQVHVTGTPQFDLHRTAGFMHSREATLALLGLSAGARYVLYAANCAQFTPTEPELVRALCRRLATEAATRRHVLLLRPHPADDRARWAGIAGSEPNLVVVPPQGADGRFGTVEAQVKLVSSLAHADVCLNMASTMSLDAAVLDVPVICVGFALARGSEEDRMAAACHQSTHYAPVTASGGVQLATSLNTLVSAVVEYVRDPARDREARRRLVSDICGLVDGGATERIRRLIEQLAGTSTSGEPSRPSLEPVGKAAVLR